MGWATIADVRSLVRTVEADAQVQSILNVAQRDIVSSVSTITGDVPASLSLAHMYLSAANLLRFMQTNGEMAYFNKMADTQTYNQIEPAIAHFMKLYETAIRKYKVSTLSSASGLYQVIHNATGDT